MADRKISDLTALTTPATGDLIPIVDISEAAAADKNKSITVGELLRGAPDGTAAAPGIAFESDGGNGMFLGGTDILAFSTGGSQAVTIDASQRVGINVTNPADTLHVRGPVSGTILNLDRAGAYSWKLGQSSGSDLTFTGDTTERVRFTNDGKVGIGSISPGSLLEVNGKTVVGSTSSDALEVFSSGDTEIGFSYNTRGNIYAKIIGDITNASPLGGDIAFQTATGGSLFERARIDSSGRLLVGTTSATGLPSTGGLKVKANNVGSASSTAALALEGTGGDFFPILFTNNNFCFYSASSPATDYLAIYNSAGNACMILFDDFKIQAQGVYSYIVGGTNRDVYVDNAGFLGYVSSTRESKTNIVDLKNIDWLYALEPVRFNRRKLKQVPYTNEEGVTTYIDSPDKEYAEEFYTEIEYGLIAEDVQQVAPEFCFYDIVDDQPELRGVHYNKLIAPLLKAVQDLKAENESLKARVTALEP